MLSHVQCNPDTPGVRMPHRVGHSLAGNPQQVLRQRRRQIVRPRAVHA
jgi:hypothetical protein